MQTVTGHLCSALGLLRGARTACSQAVSLALARRVGLASTQLGMAITRLARTLCDRVRLGLVHLSLALTQLARTLTALRIISRGVWFGFLWVVLIISIGHHVIGQHSFWDELPIWVLFLGVENKTEGVIKESFELKLPPASEGGEGGGEVAWGGRNSSFQPIIDFYCYSTSPISIANMKALPRLNTGGRTMSLERGGGCERRSLTGAMMSSQGPGLGGRGAGVLSMSRLIGPRELVWSTPCEELLICSSATRK